MNLADIETFLAIAGTKSITKTADTLYLSQPTVSHRLRMLEEELGFPLILRGKGQKTAELTPKGAAFVSVAERFAALWQETRSLAHSEDRGFLSIGCTDSLNIALMAGFYRQLQETGQPIDLGIHTHQSPELYGLLDRREIDIGFVYYHLHYNNILAERIYEERLYLAQSARPPVAKPRIHTGELDPSKELLLNWDEGFRLWHTQWFSGALRPRRQVDTILLLDRIWSDDSNWVVAPASVLRELARLRPLYISELQNPPPNRVCYKIKNRSESSAKQETIRLFETQLGAYLADSQPPLPVGEVWGGAAQDD
ncbi:MAG: LysR family transcriptional regulator [Lachnospiraceae bacterium]|jgi:DNA-binding transcriptional LysR family regulator|nr:LysR family transcriptional regulator [Lachnospiraceae bacterium]